MGKQIVAVLQLGLCGVAMAGAVSPEPPRFTHAVRVSYHFQTRDERFRQTFLNEAARVLWPEDRLLLYADMNTRAWFSEGQLVTNACIVERTIAEARACGVPHVDPVCLSTIGMEDEGAGTYGKMPYTPATGPDGKTCAGQFCLTDPKIRDYVRRKLARLASLGGDRVWLDDDIRGIWKPVEDYCYCDGCIARFNAKTGGTWTRETLVKAILADDRIVRGAWMDFIEEAMCGVLAAAREGVRSVTPAMEIGMMSTHVQDNLRFESDFNRWLRAADAVAARPGGGFWNETQPLALFGKAFGIGNQCAMTTEPKVRDVLWELEDYPRLSYKSPRMHVVECAMAVAMGCNGIMSNSALPWPDPRTRAVYAAINAARPQLNALLRARQGLKLIGASAPFRTDFDRVRPARGTWDVRAAVPLFGRFMAAYGAGWVPFAPFTDAAAPVVYLMPETIELMKDAEISSYLSRGVFVDSSGAAALVARGFGADIGLADAGKGVSAGREFLTDDPLNGDFRGFVRVVGGNPEGGMNGTTAWRTLSGVRVLGTTQAGEPTTFVFENARGGRVCVSGCAWRTFPHAPCRQQQMRNVFPWLAKGALPEVSGGVNTIPVYYAGKGRQVLFLLNASTDATGPLTVRLPSRAPETLPSLEAWCWTFIERCD